MSHVVTPLIIEDNKAIPHMLLPPLGLVTCLSNVECSVHRYEAIKRTKKEQQEVTFQEKLISKSQQKSPSFSTQTAIG